MTDPTIVWTRELLEEFKKDYANAIRRGQEVFTFEGHEILVAYARYLIEYLDGVLRPAQGRR